jgi:hypothetical protein
MKVGQTTKTELHRDWIEISKHNRRNCKMNKEALKQLPTDSMGFAGYVTVCV